MDAIKFTVLGIAQPAGSKRAMPIYRKGANGRQLVTRENGAPVIAVADANPKSREWKNVVAFTARQAYRGELLRGPLHVRLLFFRPRPKSHFGTGKNAAVLKPSADEYPTSKPDVLKLARGVEDALTGIVWGDDAQIVVEGLKKCYGEPARVEVEIFQL
jgi:crossover junction endodeoxyribonuclease RusA